MSLPLPWVDRIFEKLTLVYGHAFLVRWRDVDMDAVKHDWAAELDGFQQNPQAIAFALQNLESEKPPTVLMFRAIALRSPQPDALRLPEPKADPARVAAELGKLGHLRMVAPFRDDKAWAKKIIDRHAQGAKIGIYALKAAREVVGMGAPQ